MGIDLRQKEVLIRSFVIIVTGTIGLLLEFFIFPSDLFLLIASCVLVICGLIFFGLGFLGKLQKKKIESTKALLAYFIVWTCFGFVWLAFSIFYIILDSQAGHTHGYIVLTLGSWGMAIYYIWLYLNREALLKSIKEM